MVDDYTAKMTELIELMRMIGNDTQQCEVKECKRKISSTITDTLSAFSNGSGGWIILGLSEKNGFTPVEGFDVIWADRHHVVAVDDQVIIAV